MSFDNNIVIKKEEYKMKIAPVSTMYTPKSIINNSQRNNAVSFKEEHFYHPWYEEHETAAWVGGCASIATIIMIIILFLANIQAKSSFKKTKSEYYNNLMELVDNKCYYHPNSDGGVTRTDAELKQRDMIYNLVDSLTQGIGYRNPKRTKIEQVQNKAIDNITDSASVDGVNITQEEIDSILTKEIKVAMNDIKKY